MIQVTIVTPICINSVLFISTEFVRIM